MILILLKCSLRNTQTQLIIASMVKVDNVDYDVVSAQEVLNINWPWISMWTHFIWIAWINFQNEAICNLFWIFYAIQQKCYIQSIISDSSCRMKESHEWIMPEQCFWLKLSEFLNESSPDMDLRTWTRTLSQAHVHSVL